MTESKHEQTTLNSITDIREYLAKDARPFEQGEFIAFWKSLSDEEKHELLTTPLPQK